MAYLGLGTLGVSDTCEVTFDATNGTDRFTVCGRPKHSTIQAILVNPRALRHHRFALCRSHARMWDDGKELVPVRDYARRG